MIKRQTWPGTSGPPRVEDEVAGYYVGGIEEETMF